MSVHYKFKSSKDYDTLTFDGLHISVEDLKKSILQQKKMKSMSDFDLEITNAQTKEVYTDNSALIPKNSSVVVVRVPVSGNTKKYWDRHENSNSINIDKDNSNFGSGKLSRTADLVNANASESDKILAMMSQSSADYDPSKYVKSSSMNGPLPANYLCYRCGRPGHWIKNCPTNSIDVKRSTGIPRSFMVAVDGPDHKGAYLTSTGQFAVPAIDHAAYKNVKKDSLKKEIIEEEKEVPADLICPLCKNIYSDAVLIPCCGESFCDECIRQVLLDSENHECPVCHDEGVSPDNLLPTRSLRTAVNKFLNKTTDIPRNSNAFNSFPQNAANGSQAMKPEAPPIQSTPISNESAIKSPVADSESQLADKESKPITPPNDEPSVETTEKSPLSHEQTTSSPNASPKTVPVSSPNGDERINAVEDDRPGTPLADEAPAPSETSVASTSAVQNVSTTLPPISSIENTEPQPPGISDDAYNNSLPAQAIATLTTRGPPAIHHQTLGPSYHPRHKKHPHAGHRFPGPKSSRSAYSAPYNQTQNYLPPTNIPPPGYPPTGFSQAPSFPPPGQLPTAPAVIPPGTTFPPGVPFNPADFRNSNPYALYGANAPHPGYNFGNYDPVVQDPYHEFHRKMREKEARERYRYRRSRSRSRSRSSSTSSSHSYSRSRSRSFSRSPSPRSFSRSRSHSRSPPRYRRKAPPGSHSQRYESRYGYKKRRRSRSPVPEYRNSSPHHRPYRAPEYPPNYYGDSYYNDRVASYPTRVSPNHERTVSTSDYYDRNHKHDYRAYKNMSYTHEHRDRQNYGDLREKNHRRNDQVRMHHNSPGTTDKEIDNRPAPSRNESRPHNQKDSIPKAEKISSKNVLSDGSPKIRQSSASEVSVKNKSSDEKKEKSDSDSLTQMKKKHREKKEVTKEKPDNNVGSDNTIQNPALEKKKENEAPLKTAEISDKSKKHKHKKHKVKESDPSKKKKRKKLKGGVASTTTDTEGDLKDEKQPSDSKNATPPVDESTKAVSSDTSDIGKFSETSNSQNSKSNPEVEKDQITDVKNQSLNYVPELSKWERDEFEESPLASNLSNKRTQREMKHSLPSEIIQRAEKAILLKAPKPSMLPSVPGIVKSSSDKKGISSRSDHSTNSSKADKHNRIVYDTESIKVTIPNDEKINSKQSRTDSRKRLDRSKLFEKNNEPHRQSSVVIVKDNKLESKSLNVDSKDTARESRYRHHEKSSDNGRARRSRSPRHRERTTRYEENSQDYRSHARRNDDNRHTGSSNKLDRVDSPKRKSNNELSLKSSSSSENEKKLYKSRPGSSEKIASTIDALHKENKSSSDYHNRSKAGRGESERKRPSNSNGHSFNEKSSDKAESRRGIESEKRKPKTGGNESTSKNHSGTEDRKMSEQNDGESSRSVNTAFGNAKPRHPNKSSPNQADTLIQDDESKFVPDYDGTSHSEESSDEDVVDRNSSKSMVRDGKTSLASDGKNRFNERVCKKRKNSEDSSDSSSSEHSNLPKKSKRHSNESDEKKKSKKHKKDKKHKKHKKKKSKAKHSKGDRSKK